MFERAIYPAVRVRAGHMLVQQHGNRCRARSSRLPPRGCVPIHAAVRVRAIRESKGTTHPGSAILLA